MGVRVHLFIDDEEEGYKELDRLPIQGESIKHWDISCDWYGPAEFDYEVVSILPDYQEHEIQLHVRS